MMSYEEAMEQLPLVAILRGIRPDESLAVAEILIETGFSLIEVPLNSPDALKSIEQICQVFSDRACIGAGTVLSSEQVKAIKGVGGSLVISPNLDAAVATEAVAQDMIYLPGVVTPSEAFSAIGFGASGLKFFPAEMISPAVMKAMMAVLPKGVPLLPVGGITPDSMESYLNVGVSGFGLGSALYKPGMSVGEIAKTARAFKDAYSKLKA